MIFRLMIINKLLIHKKKKDKMLGTPFINICYILQFDSPGVVTNIWHEYIHDES